MDRYAKRWRLVDGVLVVGALLLTAGSALAQLSQEDIEKLRERGRLEGWTFTVDLNPATSYSLEELGGLIIPDDLERERAEHMGDLGYPQRDLPAVFDWRNVTGLTPVRNQGGCGSCWAFSAVGVVESAVLINEGLSTDLSEQWLVSCTTAGSCGGGWPSAAMSFMIIPGDRWFDPCDDSGAVLESAFPYRASDVPCNCPYQHPYWIHNWRYVPGDQWAITNIKQAILDYGPVSVTVAVDSAFQAYSGGVFNACWDGVLNHAVVLVGWDDTQGSNGVWIMRNSWGSGWGEGGYMRIEYGCSKIGTNALYAVYRPDCNNNGIRDDWDLADCDGSPWCSDCDGNGIPDECDIADGNANDCDGNGVPDNCQFAGLDHIYVDPGAASAGDGTSWADPLTDLNTAACIAANEPNVSEIWVKAGTFTPPGAGLDRTVSFELVDGVILRGSFAGHETAPDQRDFSDPANWTVLSGDLAGDDTPGGNRGDNSYHVVRCGEVGPDTVLDGFVIYGGQADGTGSDANGAGLFNLGGSPTLINCRLIGNHAQNFGGAVYNERTDYGAVNALLVNCELSGNSAGASGGAAYNVDTVMGDIYLNFVNCTVSGNQAYLTGGIHSIGQASVSAVNTILFGNQDDSGTGYSAQIAGDNVTLAYCCVAGLPVEPDADGNIGADPLLRDPVGADGLAGTLDDDLSLQPCSPCTDAGDSGAVPTECIVDLAGNPRLIDDPVVPDSGLGGPPVVDIGAYEYTGEHVGDLNGDGSIDLADLSIMLANYGTTQGAAYEDGDLDGDGDVDLGDLSILLSVYGTNCP